MSVRDAEANCNDSAWPRPDSAVGPPRAATHQRMDHDHGDANDDDEHEQKPFSLDHIAEHALDRLTGHIAEAANDGCPENSADQVRRDEFPGRHRAAPDQHGTGNAHSIHEAQRDDRSPAPAFEQAIDARDRSGQPRKALCGARAEVPSERERYVVAEKGTHDGDTDHGAQIEQAHVRARRRKQQHGFPFEQGAREDGDESVLMYERWEVHRLGPRFQTRRIRPMRRRAVELAEATAPTRLGRFRFAMVAAAALWLTPAAPADSVSNERRNWFDTPFDQATEGLPACPRPEGPLITEDEMHQLAHARIERGTSCWLAKKCEDSNAYRRDPEIQSRVLDALRVDPAFAGSSVWVTTERHWVTLQGCTPSARVRGQMIERVRHLAGVEEVFDQLIVGTTERARWRVDPGWRPPEQKKKMPTR